MDEIIKGLQWIKENQSYGVSGACDDLIEKCKKLTSDNSDYAKCLECADDIISDYDININPELIAKTIERHFA
jgi:hypothetical protein